MHNAQNGICNIFEGSLAISYESYTLDYIYRSKEANERAGSSRAKELENKGAQEPMMANLGGLNPFGMGARLLCIETLVKYLC